MRGIMSTVTLNNVNKKYKNSSDMAVNNFNLQVKDGEFIVLVGPSGCGKTTILRMIAGLETIDSGEIYIDNIRVNQLEPKDRDVAMVFQNYALYPHMTVEKNIIFGLSNRLENHGKRENETRKLAKDIMKKLGLSHLKDRKPRELSGGEKQRVALARALARKPKVFLMDEPLSNLDAQLRIRAREEIVNIHQELKATFIYVTHDQIEALGMGERIVIMKDSGIQQVDTPYNIFNRPANMFVAKFIGTPQMNFIDGVVKNKKDNWYLIFNNTTCNYNLLIDVTKYIGLKDGMKVKVGIRAEHVLVSTDDKNVISGKIVYREILGSNTYLHCKMMDYKLVAKVDSNNVPSHDNIDLGLDVEKLHLFCPETQNNLLTQISYSD